MPLSEDYAKDLLRNLPERLEIVLEQKKYWDVTFVRVFLDHCDRVLFDDPKRGLEMAEVARRLAEKVPEKSPFEWEHLTGEAEKQLQRELSVRAHAVLGGAYRAAARYQDAEDAYLAAFRVCASGRVSRFVEANLKKRLVRLRSAQERYDDALELLDEVIPVYRSGDSQYLADALGTKGYVLAEAGRYSEAIPLFAKALHLAKPKRSQYELASRVFQCALHNLVDAISRTCHPDDLIDALPYVGEAKRRCSKKRDSINTSKLGWVEGRIAARLGSWRLAERRFKSASARLFKLGAPFEAALVALDLSLLYQHESRLSELATLAIDTYEKFRQLSQDVHALAALRLWLDAARTRELTRASIVSAREAIEQRILKRLR